MRIAAPRFVGDVAILDVEGRLLIRAEDEPYSSVLALTGEGCRKVLLNLALLSHCDAAALGSLVRAYTTLHRKGGSLKLLKPPRQARNLLKETKLGALFGIYEEEEDALRSFAESAGSRSGRPAAQGPRPSAPRGVESAVPLARGPRRSPGGPLVGQ